MGIIEGVNVCEDCGQEVCDCGSDMMHSMDPDKVEPENDGFGDAEFWSVMDRY